MGWTITQPSACLTAVNMGDDTDTTGAVTEDLAGTLYGLDALPQEWKSVLVRYNDILQLAQSAATKFTEYLSPVRAPLMGALFP